MALLFLISDFDKPANIADLERQAAADSTNWQIRHKLIAVFIEQGNFDDALKYLNQTEDILNSQKKGVAIGQTLYLRGLYHDSQDNIPAAMENYKHAIAADSLNSRAWRKLGYLYEIFSSGEDMLDCFKHALASANDSAGVYYDLGVAYDYLDSIALAIQSYHNALALNDSISEAYLNLGVDLGYLGYPDSAEYYFGKAHIYGMESVELYYNMGVMHFDAGRIDQSIENFMTVLALDPSYSPAKMMLGNVYEAIGDSGMAKVYYLEFIGSASFLYQHDVEAVKDKLEKHYK